MYHKKDHRFQLARHRMVNEIHERGGIYSRNILSAIAKAPRHLFVSEALQYRAYEDTPLPIGMGQMISSPSVIAKMIQHLNLTGSEKILEIGTGTGYQAAVISEITSEVVVTIERIEELYKRARELLLIKLGYRNINLIHSDNFSKIVGLYDSIIVAAGAKALPVELLNKLDDNGTMIIPIKDGEGSQRIKRYFKKNDGTILEDDLGGAQFVPLIGA